MEMGSVNKSISTPVPSPKAGLKNDCFFYSQKLSWSSVHKSGVLSKYFHNSGQEIAAI
jgi:hypothetical protein